MPSTSANASVATGPGATVLTRMSGASSSARVSLRLFIPALAAAYGPVNGDPRIPAPELMFTIAPPGTHPLRGRLAPLERRREIQFELRPEHVVGRVDERPGGLLVGAADVVHPDVESAEVFHRPVGDGLGQVADVAGDDQRATAALFDPLGRHLEVGEATSVQHEIAAGVGEPPGDRPTDALTRPGHDGDAAGEIESVQQIRCHGVLLIDCRHGRQRSQTGRSRGRN